MKWFFVLLFISSLAQAKSDFLAHKNGIVFGLGAAGSRYTFPAEYAGTGKSKLDDKTTLLGGVLQLGYDFTLFDRMLLGLRGEGVITDNFGMGNDDDNTLNGRTRSATALIRAGYLFHGKFWDLVGDPAPLMVEAFAEAGRTSGHRNIVLEFDPQGVDVYNDDLTEEYQGNVISFGVNLMNGKGAFLELKSVHTSITNTRQKFEGTKVEGGVTSPTDRTLSEEDNFHTWMLVIGQHF